jgi:hypothetical protein
VFALWPPFRGVVVIDKQKVDLELYSDYVDFGAPHESLGVRRKQGKNFGRAISMPCVAQDSPSRTAAESAIVHKPAELELGAAGVEFEQNPADSLGISEIAAQPRR